MRKVYDVFLSCNVDKLIEEYKKVIGGDFRLKTDDEREAAAKYTALECLSLTSVNLCENCAVNCSENSVKCICVHNYMFLSVNPFLVILARDITG